VHIEGHAGDPTLDTVEERPAEEEREPVTTA
jgi:hypothetical protein